MFSQALCSWDIDYFCIQGPIQLASDVVLHSLASGADCCPGDSTTVTHLPSHLWTASPPAGHKTRNSACPVREEMVENSTNAQWQTVQQSRSGGPWVCKRARGQMCRDGQASLEGDMSAGTWGPSNTRFQVRVGS